MSAIALCAVVGILLLALAWLGVRTRGHLGALLLAQSLWFAMSYVARPLFLLAYQPTPRQNDHIADARLASLGYEDGLQPVLGIVALCLAVYLVLLWVVQRFLRSKSGTLETLPPAFSVSDGVSLLAVGWAGRLLVLSSGGAFAETVGFLASIGAGLIIMRTTNGSRAVRFGLFGLVLGSELLWSLLAATKAPIFACALWLLLVLLVRRRLRLRYLLILCAAAAMAFGLVQGAKTSFGMLTVDQSVIQSYPPAARAMIPFVQRFDLVSAGLDAYLAGPGSWISPTEAADRLARSLLPSSLMSGKSGQVGADWAIHVRSMSVEDSNTGVHLAEGPIAEGYILGGLGGSLFEMGILAFAVVSVASALKSSSPFLVAVGLLMTSQPILFERGLLGLGEGFGKALQVGIMAWLVLLVHRNLRGHGSGRIGSAKSTVNTVDR